MLGANVGIFTRMLERARPEACKITKTGLKDFSAKLNATLTSLYTCGRAEIGMSEIGCSY